MFGLFAKREKHESAPLTITAQGTEIHYDPNLISNFHDEHKILLDLFGKISESANSGKFDEVKNYLNKFTKLLRSHLLKENLKLYLYLQHALSKDKESQKLVGNYRHEMQGIGKAVNAFVTKYRDSDFESDAQRSEFQRELDAIGPVLVERINNEENILYPLYDVPDSYKMM